MRKKMTICKNDDRLLHRKSKFYYKKRTRFNFRHLTLKKNLKGVLQNIYLIIDLLYCNPLITTVVDGSIFILDSNLRVKG